MLSNFETDSAKLLQILLLGQPELATKLNDPRLKQFKQRISLRYHISPLTRQDTSAYIRHRLKVSGYAGERPLFSTEAEEVLFAYSKGFPRSINSLCDNALLTGYVREKREITPEMIGEIIQELEGVTGHG